ncbi:hypothetical protein BT63DRAFT_467260 [Microthyrium microscopicum]|uniref:Malate dehydrogenase n=1 Tax=Microthyrium microscopicum TaxID=703497 RepID=A0A6A6UPJ0_9PEZI|nr:hypothetical protein BT63DRAFT_467260 [Microthyrium microscopicum]
MRSILLVSSSLLATLTSAYVIPSASEPTGLVNKRQLNPLNAAVAFRAIVERFTGDAKLASTDPTASSICNVNGAKMPAAPTPLPDPSAGLILDHVAVGRGTQNYTCADNTANSIPAANGAIASLFNATCMAAPYPQLLSAMPGIALNFAVPDSTVAETFLSGHHLFLDKTTPFFNLDTDSHQWGTVSMSKTNSANAPNAAKDVAWLKLTAKDTTGTTISEVYRVNTAGGQPPATCAGMPANFEVQYSAVYWMWAKP